MAITKTSIQSGPQGSPEFEKLWDRILFRLVLFFCPSKRSSHISKIHFTVYFWSVKYSVYNTDQKTHDTIREAAAGVLCPVDSDSVILLKPPRTASMWLLQIWRMQNGIKTAGNQCSHSLIDFSSHLLIFMVQKTFICINFSFHFYNCLFLSYMKFTLCITTYFNCLTLPESLSSAIIQFNTLTHKLKPTA